MSRLEQINEEISRIDSKVKVITERPFRSEKDEESRELAVNGLMDERDELFKEKTKLEAK